MDYQARKSAIGEDPDKVVTSIAFVGHSKRVSAGPRRAHTCATAWKGRRGLKAATDCVACDLDPPRNVNLWAKCPPIADNCFLIDAVELDRDAVKVRHCHVLPVCRRY